MQATFVFNIVHSAPDSVPGMQQVFNNYLLWQVLLKNFISIEPLLHSLVTPFTLMLKIYIKDACKTQKWEQTLS